MKEKEIKIENEFLIAYKKSFEKGELKLSDLLSHWRGLEGYTEKEIHNYLESI